MRLALFAVLLLPLAAAEGERRLDVEFAKPNGISLKLDAWVPAGKGPFPTAIIVHGGGWVAGDKAIEWVQPLFRPLEEAGFGWISINYRLTPQAPFPAMMEDTFAAIDWVNAHAAEYKVDRKRVALIGESAGGHIVAYVGARARGKQGVQAVVDFYGPHDLAAQIRDRDNGNAERLMKQLFQGPATPEQIRAASPITYVHKGMPPFLFIHGTDDKLVPYNQSPLMCEAMKKVGVPCEVITVQDGPHGMSNWEKKPEWTVYKQPMIAWLKKTLRVR